jgi:hypothetical protein
METSALLTTLFVAIAGPVGITLGWWLGRRSERDRTAREERKAAYVNFTSASIKFRNADDAERLVRRNERWEALAVLTMVAPPEMVRIAAHMCAAGEALLDRAVDADARHAIYQELWLRINEFTRLARADLKVGDIDAFAGLDVVAGDRLSFVRPDP